MAGTGAARAKVRVRTNAATRAVRDIEGSLQDDLRTNTFAAPNGIDPGLHVFKPGEPAAVEGPFRTLWAQVRQRESSTLDLGQAPQRAR